MMVPESAVELPNKLKTYATQEDPWFSQESNERDDEINHKNQLNDDTAEHPICGDMNLHSVSLSDFYSKNPPELNLCSDKAVQEVSPKLVCCFTEGYHNIKDICIDEGLPTNGNHLIGNIEAVKEKPPDLLRLDVDEHREMFTEGDNTGESALNDFSVDFKDKQRKDHNMHFLVSEVESIYDDDVDKLGFGDSPGPIKYVAREKLMSNATNKVSAKASFHEPAVADNATEKQDHQIKSREKVTEMCASNESLNCNSAEEASPVSTTETKNGGLLLNSETPLPHEMAGKCVEQPIDCTNGCQDDHALSEPDLEHGSVSLGASFRSFVHEMDSPKMRNLSTNPAEVFGQPRNSIPTSIADSGPFGSISLRSDSSTVSTRSFAFPILPSERNASPVKMAKADGRLFRKLRGWRVLLLCCRS